MSSAKRDELEQRRERLARNEQLARTGPARARFAYAAAATKQRARIARLERELENEQPQRFWIGRSRTGEAVHLVPKPGTAFPLGSCGADVDRQRMKTAEDFVAVTCRRCRNIGRYSITPREEA